MQKLKFIDSKGEELNLTEGNFGVINWSGLSECGQEIQTQKVPFYDGSVFLDNLLNERELSFEVAMNDDKDLELRYQLRRELISKLNPKLGEGYLIYENDFISKRIKVVPDLPIIPNKNFDEAGTIKVELVFTATEPYWEDLEETETETSLINKGVAINSGDIPSQVEMIVDTSYVKNLTIYNEANGKKIRFPEELTTRTFIDTNLGRKSVNDFERLYELKSFNNIHSIAYSANLDIYIGVGHNGMIIKSNDGENWDSVTSNINNNLFSVIYVEKLGLFVAGGTYEISSSNGQIITSPDGINWTPRVGVGGISILSITYSNKLGLFVAVTSGGVALTSSDGITWTQRTTGVYSSLSSVTYSETLELFVAVGNNNKIITSPDGIIWTVRNFHLESPTMDVNFKKVIYVEEYDKFYAVGSWEAVVTSSDGITWGDEHAVLVNRITYDIVYSEVLDMLVTVSEDGRINYKTRDSYWVMSKYTDVTLETVIYNEITNKFIVYGYNNSTKFVSNNGKDWVEKNGIIYNIKKIIYAKNKGLYIAINNGSIFKSQDCINWIKVIDNINNQDVIYSESLNICVVVDSSRIITSSDLETWTKRTYSTNTLQGVTYSTILNLFVAVGFYGTIITSPDGINWTTQTSGTQIHLISVINSETLHQFVAVGEDGIILTSSNGINWTIQTSGTSVDLQNVAYSENLGKYIAVGFHRTIISSTDGITWKTVYSGTIYDLNYQSVIYDEILKLFLIVGENGVILTSKNGINWLEESFGSGAGLCSIFLDYEHLFIGGSVTVLSYFSKSLNKIDKISTDSDMTFNLDQGENPIRISYTNGEASVTIRHRNKYIGV